MPLNDRIVTLRQALIAGGRLRLLRRTEDGREDYYEMGTATVLESALGNTQMQADDVVLYGWTGTSPCFPGRPARKKVVFP